TRAERMDNARKLEEIRVDLAPMFAFFEGKGIARGDVASLWAFTVTRKTELAMDKASQRMPLPINLMIDPHTGHVDIPAAPWDRPFEAAVKTRLGGLTGFGLSSAPLLEFTAPMTRSTVNAQTIKLYELAGAPVAVDADIELLPDLMHVIVKPKQQRFDEATSYMVVVTRDVRDAAGKQVVTMPAGHFLTARTQVFADGASRVQSVEVEDAEKLERARTQIAQAIERVGRDRVLAAWPFTTMEVKRPLVDWRLKAETVGVSPQPTLTARQSPGDAVADFPLGITALTNVADVYHGTIASPFYLDTRSTALRGDGGHQVQDVAFTLTTPKHPRPGPIPVVIFGHGLVTERRFVLAVAGALANKGYAAVSIDFPYHGTRTYCAKGGPISVINPSTGQALSLEPCGSGTTCNDEGKCVDAAGQGNKLAKWPILDLPIASGAVFTDVNHIASTKDHFLQALVDLGALDRSLRKGNWSPLLGRAVDTSRIYYTGQSLGGIMGAIFLGTQVDISRAVLNVPGADLIRMFDESTFFSSHLDGLFTREGVDKASFDGRRLLEVAKWIMDVVDPQHLGHEIGARSLLIQMATLDFIIPNDSTKELESVTRAVRRDYLAEHGFITIPVEPEYYRGVNDLAKWLNGESL
ncbi:MAG TPA: Ig-like domain-containing protein, partial [Kofleriaceae bacterium]|nr:Ig-like domain-containing protein [Kofleriaceae bacterium]